MTGKSRVFPVRTENNQKILAIEKCKLGEIYRRTRDVYGEKYFSQKKKRKKKTVHKRAKHGFT